MKLFLYQKIYNFNNFIIKINHYIRILKFYLKNFIIKNIYYKL